jgi:hypothetical protein
MVFPAPLQQRKKTLLTIKVVYVRNEYLLKIPDGKKESFFSPLQTFSCLC